MAVPKKYDPYQVEEYTHRPCKYFAVKYDGSEKSVNDIVRFVVQRGGDAEVRKQNVLTMTSDVNNPPTVHFLYITEHEDDKPKPVSPESFVVFDFTDESFSVMSSEYFHSWFVHETELPKPAEAEVGTMEFGLGGLGESLIGAGLATSDDINRLQEAVVAAIEKGPKAKTINIAHGPRSVSSNFIIDEDGMRPTTTPPSRPLDHHPSPREDNPDDKIKRYVELNGQRFTETQWRVAELFFGQRQTDAVNAEIRRHIGCTNTNHTQLPF